MRLEVCARTLESALRSQSRFLKEFLKRCCSKRPCVILHDGLRAGCNLVRPAHPSVLTHRGQRARITWVLEDPLMPSILLLYPGETTEFREVCTFVNVLCTRCRRQQLQMYTGSSSARSVVRGTRSHLQATDVARWSLQSCLALLLRNRLVCSFRILGRHQQQKLVARKELGCLV